MIILGFVHDILKKIIVIRMAMIVLLLWLLRMNSWIEGSLVSSSATLSSSWYVMYDEEIHNMNYHKPDTPNNNRKISRKKMIWNDPKNDWRIMWELRVHPFDLICCLPYFDVMTCCQILTMLMMMMMRTHPDIRSEWLMPHSDLAVYFLTITIIPVDYQKSKRRKWWCLIESGGCSSHHHSYKKIFTMFCS